MGNPLRRVSFHSNTKTANDRFSPLVALERTDFRKIEGPLSGKEHVQTDIEERRSYLMRKQLLITLVVVIAGCTLLGHADAQENASNPLAAVNSTDLRYQYFDLGGAYLTDAWLDGAYMLNPKVKLKYEVHYWTSDQTGMRLSNLESLHLKAIWYPSQGEWGSWKYKAVIALEWIKGWGNVDLVLGYRSIGSSADQLGPFVGLSLVKGGTVLVPLLQHFVFIRWSGREYDRRAVDSHSVASE